jgi:cyclic beta-1,2-glucan synthetase
MYQAGVEAILGLRLQGGGLILEPCIPRDWGGYEIDVRHGSATYEIRVGNPTGANRGIASIELDGTRLDDDAPIPLHDDGARHRVDVVMGVRPTRAPARG